MTSHHQGSGHVIKHTNQMCCAVAAMVVMKQFAVLLIGIVIRICHLVCGHDAMICHCFGVGVPGKGKSRPKVGEQQYAGEYFFHRRQFR